MINRTLQSALERFGDFLCRARRGKYTSKIIEKLKLLLRRAENLNFDIQTNGEERVLRCICEKNPQVVFDVGANIGEWSLLASTIFSSCTIHAFEIVPETFDLLRENCPPSVKPNNVGLSDCQGEVAMYLSSQTTTVATANKIENMGYHESYYDKVIIGKTITGKIYMEENKIDKIEFLKIDVEGMDFKVLAGFADKLGVIDVVQFEYGIFNISSKDLLIDFFNLLIPYNFRIGKIFPNHVEFFDYHFSKEDFGGHNYIAIKNTEVELIRSLENLSN